MKNEASSVGLRIKKRREELGMTQDKLSDLTDISTTQISAYENNRKQIGLFSLGKIASALETTIDELYFGKPSERPLTSALNEGELIINCVYSLYKHDVLSLKQHEESNGYESMIVESVGIKNHEYVIEDLINKLIDFSNNKSDYTDPDLFEKQLLQAAINKINNKKIS